VYRTCLLLLLTATTFNVGYAQEPHEPTIIAEAPQPQSLFSFRKALIKASEEAYRDGEITRGELFKIRIASMNRKALEQMHNAVAEQAIFEGKSPATLDWTTLLAFIKAALPIILELIKLFS
jgi:hypothetical protein